MQKIDTRCLHAGYVAKNGEPRQLPIIQSTTFKYDTSEEMAKLFDLEASGYFYTRLQNPTNDLVSKKICDLEGGKSAMLTSSGQAASFFSIFNIANAGDHIIVSSSIYGGTYNLIAITMKKMGIETTFVSPMSKEEDLDKAFKKNTKLIFGETISNPALTVLDLELFAKVAHKHGVPLIVDNTFPTPINCRPIEWGADIVLHSTTKYMDGHGISVGGAIVDAGNFDWLANKEKFPGMCTPDESYHGIVYAEKFGKENAFIVKCTAQLMRDFGSIQSPQNAFYINNGLETLAIRMERHSSSALKIAEILEKNEKIKEVIYPGLKSNKYYALAKKYCPNGASGVISIILNGGREKASEFMKNLELIAIETHVADAKSCCLCPSVTTHRQMTDKELLDAGIDPGLVRISIGLENFEDLREDIENSLNNL